ncbi:putative NodT, RND efflux system, outer membrane lipoprotein [Sinorhizobium fredii HH103]|uniref:NodT, RND efflux system, outer membrane lipoprotein n=2 Tax=Rhizobium fredii TaxID=380 RepID=G9A5U8_SINF1|nr:putative NodT, RND efflux system, outer membrane lipoprotein [Sinorhizobium fredii HH103]
MLPDRETDMTILPARRKVPSSRTGTTKLALSLLSISLLAGCVVGPDYEQPRLALPTRWGSKEEQKPAKPPELSQWWLQLRDPLLNSLVAEAVEGNLDVALAKAKIREARATYREQQGTLFPSVDGSVSATRTRSTSSVAGSQPSVYSQYQGGFDASWELDLFGGNRRGLEAARYGAEAAEEELRDTLVTLVGDVASYYIQAREYQSLLALARRSAASQRETAKLTQEQFTAGEATGVDDAKADAQATSTEADIPTYQISYAQTIHRLSILLGQPPAALEGRLKKGGAVPLPKAPVSTGIPAELLVNRPDVRLAERQLAQSTAKIGQAEANRYPSISLTGNIATSALSTSDLGKKSTIGWSFGPTLTVPIFEGGRLKAAVDVAKAQRDQYYVAYQAAVLSAMEDVENAIVSLSQTRTRYAKLSSSAASYRRAAELSRTLNAAGAVDFLDVLDAERSLYTAEEALIRSRADIAIYFIALNKALGGGWDGGIDVSKPAVVDVNTEPHLARAKPHSSG